MGTLAPPAATFTPTTPTLAMKTIAAAVALCLLLGSAVAQEEPEEMMSLMDAEGMMMMEDPVTGMMMTEDGTMMMDPAMMVMMDAESEMYIDEDGMVMPMTEEMMAMMDGALPGAMEPMEDMTGMEGMMTEMEGDMP